MSGSKRVLHRTMSGREINMEALRFQHADMKARGNASMNARGDILDLDGKIKISRDQIVQQYNLSKSSDSIASLKKSAIENAESPAQAIERMEKEINAKRLAASNNSDNNQIQDQQMLDLPNPLPKKARRLLLDKSE